MRRVLLSILVLVACGEGSDSTAADGGPTADATPGLDAVPRSDARSDADAAGDASAPDGGGADAAGLDAGRDALPPDATVELGPGSRFKTERPERSARFGAAVAADVDWVAGAAGASGCGAGVDPRPVAGCPFAGEAVIGGTVRLKSPTPGDRDAFGTAVATAGAEVFVGAPREDACPGNPTGNGCTDTGAVHVFRRADDTWAVTDRLAATVPAGSEAFGSAIAVDGDWLVVGAPGVDACSSEACPDAGAVFVFGREEGAWVPRQRLADPAPQADARFGASVALRGDVLVVGAPDDPRCPGGAPGCTQTGSAHVFTLTSTIWTPSTSLRSSAGSTFDRFGAAVAVESSTVVVGSVNDASCGSGVGPDDSNLVCSTSGAVEVFVRESDRWRSEVRIKGQPSGNGDLFGAAVSLEDGRLYVGAPGEASCFGGAAIDPNDDGCPRAGAVSAFVRFDDRWQAAGFFKASFVRAGQRFGGAVAGGEGGLVIGVPRDDSCAADDPTSTGCFESGRVEVFE